MVHVSYKHCLLRTATLRIHTRSICAHIFGKERFHRSICWLQEACRRKARCLTVAPDQFDIEIVTKKVTNGADLGLLKSKYLKTFLAVVVPAKVFEFADMPKEGAEAWTQFLNTTIPRCRDLTKVDLSENEKLLSTLEPFACLAVLEELWLINCSGVHGSLEPLSGLAKLRILGLAGCMKMEGTLTPLSRLAHLAEADLEACVGLQGSLEPLWGLTNLTRLNVCDTGPPLFA